jgi:penicillin-binding protein 1A
LKSKWEAVGTMGCLVSLVLMVVLGLGGFGWWATHDLPPVEELLASQKTINSHQSTQVFAGDGTTVIFSNGAFKHKKVPLSQISPALTEAIVATEDRRFYWHKGVDPISIGRATIRNFTDKGLSEGASTITQQLARTLFLTQERSARRKFREMWLAIQLEQHFTKQELLEMYLNSIYFGEGAYGVEAAAQVYFGKSVKDLTIPQAALIAGLPQAPSRLDPFINPEMATRRRNEVLDNLVEVGKVKSKDVAALKKQGLTLHAPSLGRQSAGDLVPYFNRLVQQRIMNWYGLNEQEFWQAGFKIYTTLDIRAQRLAEQAVERASLKFGRSKQGQEAALVAMNAKDGAIIAYVGGRNYRQSQYDRASMARRSPGSLFKVITYTAALMNGFKPDDVQVDEPVHYGNWTPENYDRRHAGRMTLAQAFAQSNNIIAVKLLYEVSPQTVVDLAGRMGVESPLKPFLALTLGGSSVTLLEMVGAVNTVNNQGIWTQPFVVNRIVDGQDQVVYEHEPRVRDVVSPEVAGTMVKMMQGVVDYGTGRAARFGGRPVAGKSGTSDKNKDAWFVGFTPTTIAGVWAGNDNNTSMGSTIAGGTLPATAWRLFMEQYLANQPIVPFGGGTVGTVSPGSDDGGEAAQWYQGQAPSPTQEGGVSAEGVPLIELRNLLGDPNSVRPSDPSTNTPDNSPQPVPSTVTPSFGPPRPVAPVQPFPAPPPSASAPVRPNPSPPPSSSSSSPSGGNGQEDLLPEGEF